MPDYVKIDVDGIEHLILRGMNDFLKNSKIKGLSIELNENFKEQYNEVIDILNKSNFDFKHKKHSAMFNNENKFSKTYNFIFERHN